MSKSAVGLDIGDNHICAVEITRSLKVIKMKRCTIQSSLPGDAEILSEKVRRFFESHDFTKGNVITNLHGSQIITRTYKPSSGRDYSFEDWFVENANRLIPGVRIDEIVFDHEILSSGRALISYAKRDAIEERLKILINAGICATCIDASCLALYYAFAGHDRMKQKVDFMILDVRHCHSDIILIMNSEPFVSCEVPVGIGHMSALGNDIVLFASNLAAHINRIIDYYRTRENMKIAYCLLTGGGRKTRSLPGHLASHLGMEVERGVISMNGERLEHDNGNYVQAFGLALKGVSNKDVKRINLLTSDIKLAYGHHFFSACAKRLFQHSAPYIVLMALLFAVVTGFLMTINKRYDLQICRLITTRQTLLTEKNHVEHLLNKIKAIQMDSQPRFFWSKFLHVLGGAVPNGIELFKVESDTRLSGNGKSPVRNLRIYIEGNAEEHARVMVFIRKLEKIYHGASLDEIKGVDKCKFRISVEP